MDMGQLDQDAKLEELSLLSRSAGAENVLRVKVRRRTPNAATFIGSGKAVEIKESCDELGIDLVIFDHDLTPTQQRNLEQVLDRRVIDRTGLILDIFAIRAESFEGKLQVELAQLQYMASRLVRRHSHLAGQQGGIGMRGPGETQLETDRRLIGVKISQLKTRLEKLRKQRQTQRRQRERKGQFTVAIVGYTNAGKSTLFNALATSKAYAADQLFATLDTTSRKVYLAPGANMVLSDTVGFIRDLSHSLIEAFKATLESTVHADLLLHVVDVTSPLRHEHMAEVNKVLEEIQADDLPQIVVWNKIDSCERLPEVLHDDNGKILSVAVSARHGLGISQLRDVLAQCALEFESKFRNFNLQSASEY